MKFSVITVAAAALSLFTANNSMAMEQPKQSQDEIAIISLEKLNNHYAMIQNYLSQEVIKIKYSTSTLISNSEQKKLTDFENQRIQRLNELSETLTSVQKNAMNDIFLNQQYAARGTLNKSSSDKRLKVIAFCKGGYSHDNNVNLSSENKEKLAHLAKEKDSISEALGATYLETSILLTDTQIEEANADATYILEQLTKPNSYLCDLHQICLSLFSEIAQPWCGSNEITLRYINTEVLPNLKKLKFENQSRAMQLGCKIATFSNDKKVSSLKEKLAAEEKMSEQLTYVIQSLESTSLLEDAFSDAFEKCSSEQAKRFLAQLKK